MVRDTRYDVRHAVIDHLKDSECWVSLVDVGTMLGDRGIPVPEQLASVLWNMVKHGWLKKGRAYPGKGGVRYYLVEGQICREQG